MLVHPLLNGVAPGSDDEQGRSHFVQVTYAQNECLVVSDRHVGRIDMKVGPPVPPVWPMLPNEVLVPCRLRSFLPIKEMDIVEVDDVLRAGVPRALHNVRVIREILA